MAAPHLIPWTDRHTPSPTSTPEDCARSFYEILRKRRSIREFSSQPVSRATIEWIVRCACTAPSGANKQPWRFLAVQDPAKKREIRLAAEKEEREFYAKRANPQWLRDLAPLGTDPEKPFLETAPWLIVVFKLIKGDDDSQVYYVNESVGIAVGMLLLAAHHAGLGTLTHTPSPMGFLGELLERKKHERPFLLIPVGYPAETVRVPYVATLRKPLEDVLEFL